METGNESSYAGQVSRLRKMIRRILIGIVLLVILVVGFIGWSFYAAIYKWQSPASATVEIDAGLPVSVIAQKLAENRVIKTPQIFSVFVRVRGLSSKLKAGEYEFPAAVTADGVLSMMVKGQVKKYQLQIIEGWTIKDIAKYLSELTFLKDPNISAEFLRLTSDKAYIQSLGFKDLNSLEGYLFPDTYEVLRPKSADEIIKRLVTHFREIYTPECTALADKLQMSQNQIVTLASIIEKETGKADERPIIASVFYNRLKQNMALQSDPTIIYGIPNFDGNLKREDLENGANLYNTYRHLGLTPSPICNPGKAVIDAALQPATTKYLYFVAKNDGSHVFSETFEEHQRAVAQYQLGKAFVTGPTEATSGEVEPPAGVIAIPPLVSPKGGTMVPLPPVPKQTAPTASPALPALPAQPAVPPPVIAPTLPGPSLTPTTPPASTVPPTSAAPAPTPTTPVAPTPAPAPAAPSAVSTTPPSLPTLPSTVAPTAPAVPSVSAPASPITSPSIAQPPTTVTTSPVATVPPVTAPTPSAPTPTTAQAPTAATPPLPPPPSAPAVPPPAANTTAPPPAQ